MWGWEQIYSTVGHRVPICLLRMLLNIWVTSFSLKVYELQVSYECHQQPAAIELLCQLSHCFCGGSLSCAPHRSSFIACRDFDTSSEALSVFLSCFSKMARLSFRILTISAGFLCDLLNKGIFFIYKNLFFQYGMPGLMKLPACLSNNKQTHGEVLKTALFSSSKHFRWSSLYLPFNKGCLLLLTCARERLSTIPSWLSDSEE